MIEDVAGFFLGVHPQQEAEEKNKYKGETYDNVKIRKILINIFFNKEIPFPDLTKALSWEAE